MNRSLCIGLFVGGKATRMGGFPKGNLEVAPGVRVVDRLVEHCQRALPGAPLVLVGAAEAYADLGLPVLVDAPAGVGPLGGLRALLLFTEGAGHSGAIALACDLPYLESELVERLASTAPDAAFVAAKDGELWHTLAARYGLTALSAVDATLAAGERALQRVIRRLGDRAVELDVTPEEARQLRDWDEPGDREQA